MLPYLLSTSLQSLSNSQKDIKDQEEVSIKYKSWCVEGVAMFDVVVSGIFA